MGYKNITNQEYQREYYLKINIQVKNIKESIKDSIITEIEIKYY
jgi:hypothetical protein